MHLHRQPRPQLQRLFKIVDKNYDRLIKMENFFTDTVKLAVFDEIVDTDALAKNLRMVIDDFDDIAMAIDYMLEETN